MKLPKRIEAVEYGGFFDFNADGFYGPSLLDEEHNPNAEHLATEIARQYNAFSPVQEAIKRFKQHH